jgi:hypothetical protein
MSPKRRARDVCAAAVVTSVAFACPSRADERPDDKKECLDSAERGQSQRDDGKYRDAHESFLACTRDVCPKILAQSCTRWLRDLDQDAPTIVFGAKDEEGNDVVDVKVSVDGESFATLLDGKPVLADAGEHVLRFERDGSVPVEQRVVLRAGERARLVTAVLRSVQPITSQVIPEPTPPGAEKLVEPEPFLSPRHVATGAFAVGAIAAAATGAFFVLESNRDKDSAATLRVGLASNACTHAGTTATCSALSDKVDAQHREMTVATTLFVGAGGLAVGAVLGWLFWPHSAASPKQLSAAITPSPGGATAQVGWRFR